MDDVSKLHTVPIRQWIQDGVVFKFWGDNVDKQQHVRDLQLSHKGEMLHMFSLLLVPEDQESSSGCSKAVADNPAIADPTSHTARAHRTFFYLGVRETCSVV